MSIIHEQRPLQGEKDATFKPLGSTEHSQAARGASQEISYNAFYGLEETPFSIAPNPRFLFMSEQHQEALAHLIYGVNAANGFVLLTGEVGTGKTTVIRAFLQKLPDDARVAYVVHATLTARELLETIAEELHVQVKPDASHRNIVAAIHQKLLEHYGAGFRTFLLIDEAQNLAAEVLEEIRMLTNLETDDGKLLHIILVGQPELRDMFQDHGLRQLNQRVSARYHLQQLSQSDVSLYLQHRLAVAQAPRNPFTLKAMKTIARVTCGIPRLVNMVADRALLAGFARQQFAVDHLLVKAASREIFAQRTVAQRIKRFLQKRPQRAQAVALQEDMSKLRMIERSEWVKAVVVVSGISAILGLVVWGGMPKSEQVAGLQTDDVDVVVKKDGSESFKEIVQSQNLSNTDSVPTPGDSLDRSKQIESENEKETEAKKQRETEEGKQTDTQTPTQTEQENENQQEETGIRDSGESTAATDVDVKAKADAGPIEKNELPAIGPAVLTKSLTLNKGLVGLQQYLSVDGAPVTEIEELGCDAFSGDIQCVAISGRLESLLKYETPFLFKLAPGQLRSIGVAYEPGAGETLIRFTWFLVTGFNAQAGEIEVKSHDWQGRMKVADLSPVLTDGGQFLMASPLKSVGPRELFDAEHSQWIITRIGFSDGSKLDPIFDLVVSDQTFKAAVQAFQNRQNLKADGLFGVHTLLELNRVLFPEMTRLTGL